MGHRLSASEETELLRATVREAHAALSALRTEIRAAERIAPSLVQEFEKLHQREMEQLSNHMTAEGNRAAADLNTRVNEARDWILYQLTAQDLVLDPENRTVRLGFRAGRFDDQVPPPYPHRKPKETNQ